MSDLVLFWGHTQRCSEVILGSMLGFMLSSHFLWCWGLLGLLRLKIRQSPPLPGEELLLIEVPGWWLEQWKISSLFAQTINQIISHEDWLQENSKMLAYTIVPRTDHMKFHPTWLQGWWKIFNPTKDTLEHISFHTYTLSQWIKLDNLAAGCGWMQLPKTQTSPWSAPSKDPTWSNLSPLLLFCHLSGVRGWTKLCWIQTWPSYVWSVYTNPLNYLPDFMRAI